jgi:hypothetical protein
MKPLSRVRKIPDSRRLDVIRLTVKIDGRPQFVFDAEIDISLVIRVEMWGIAACDGSGGDCC